MKPIVICGSGRSGTLFFASLLGELGVPATHEQVFHPSTSGWPADFVDIEASWLAAAFIDAAPRHVVIVHLVRDPTSVCRSLIGREFFRYSSRDMSGLRALRHRAHLRSLPKGRRQMVGFAERHFRTIIDQPSESGRCAAYWCEVNGRVLETEESHVYVRVRIEDLDRETVADVLTKASRRIPNGRSIDSAFERARATSHASNLRQRQRANEFDPKDLSDALKDRVGRLASEFGYSWSTS